MWLEKGKARVVTIGQMAQMLRQAQHDVASSVMERLPNILERVLGEHFAAFKSSIMGCIEDKVQSIVKTEMQERQAASLPSGVYEHPRQTSEGFPETGGITRVKLRFVNVDRPEDPLFTGCPVKWQNGENPKVAIFENDTQITQGDLSKLQIEILPVYADFFTEQGHEGFTKEEFSKQICMCNGKESVLKTVKLTNGECSLGSVIFTESSQRKNLRLTARVKRQNLVVRVQEAITDPFVVKDRRSIFNEKSTTPSKEDAVHQLKGISPKGKRCEKLASKNITKVKHLLRHYHKDNFGLQKLIGMKKRAWNTMIEHATGSLPGDEIYSYWVPNDNCEILFNDFYDLVGKMTDDYVPYSVNDVDQFPQRKVNNWKKSAYKKFDERESSGHLTPDYLMNNGRPVRAVNNDAGPSVQGLSQHNTSMPQNGAPDYPPHGNVLNDQGSFSAHPTLPSHILVPAPVTGASLTGQQNGYLRFSTTDAPVTSYPVADVGGTSSDGVSLGTSSLDHVPVNISSGPPSDEFVDWIDELLAAGEYEADQGIAPANIGELPNSNIQYHGYDL